MTDYGVSSSHTRRLAEDHDNFPDDARTTRSHAGEGIQDGYNIPGIVLWALGLVALGLTLTAAGYGFHGWAVIGAIVCATALVTGSAWLVLEHRRIKAKEGRALTDPAGH
ncbi:hypothetical protein ACFYO1_17035 [Nocardia sp. NPDC006044]|uniref:hypothetical protein n=1 Tax=Nocardia sp. NPDC006044 TaxID=3364306 RepID=UPI0036B243D2